MMLIIIALRCVNDISIAIQTPQQRDTQISFLSFIFF